MAGFPALPHALQVLKAKPALAGGIGLAGAAGAAVYVKKRKASTAGTGASGVIIPATPAKTADTSVTDLASLFGDQLTALEQQIADLNEKVANPTPVNPPVTQPTPSINTPLPAGGGGGPVNWGVLSSLQAAGYDEVGVKNLAAAQAVGAPPPTPAQANSNAIGGPVNWDVLRQLAASGLNEQQIRELDAAQHAGR